MPDDPSWPARLARLEAASARMEVLNETLRNDMTKIESQLEKVLGRIATSERRYYTALGAGLAILFLIEKFLLK